MTKKKDTEKYAKHGQRMILYELYGPLGSLFPNPLLAPVGQRKTAAYIYTLHTIIAGCLFEIIVGLYAHVLAGVDANSVVSIMTTSNWLFGTGVPLALAVYGVSNAAEWKYRGAQTNMGYGAPYDPYSDSGGVQQGSVNIRVGAPKEGDPLPELPERGVDGD